MCRIKMMVEKAFPASWFLKSELKIINSIVFII